MISPTSADFKLSKYGIKYSSKVERLRFFFIHFYFYFDWAIVSVVSANGYGNGCISPHNQSIAHVTHHSPETESERNVNERAVTRTVQGERGVCLERTLVHVSLYFSLSLSISLTLTLDYICGPVQSLTRDSSTAASDVSKSYGERM